MPALNISKNTAQFVQNAQAEMGATSGNWTVFLTALGRRESSGLYGKVNDLGYLGMYQFSPFNSKDSIFTTLHFKDYIGAMLGATDDASFLNNPIAQELAAIMEFSGIPDMTPAAKFTSKFTAIRNAFALSERPHFDSMIDQTFTINWTNKKGEIVETQEITLSKAGLSAAAHLAGEGRVQKALKAIYDKAYDGNGDRISPPPAIPLSLDDDYADGNGVAFSTYIKLFQDFDVSPLLDASDGKNLTQFNQFAQELITSHRNEIINYLTAINRQKEVVMKVSVGTEDYRETIRAILNGIGLPTSDLVNTDGQVILAGGNNTKFTNNADLVIGLGNSNNTLSGGIGNDVLIGGQGTDILKGGTGTDVYIYKEGDGADIINDATGSGGDGLGQILYTRADGSSKALAGDIPAGVGKGQASDGEFTYTFIGKEGIPEGVGTLIITRAGTSDKITVEHFKNGDLGLNLHLAKIDRATYQGTADTDDLTGPADQNKILLAGAGNDRVVNGPGDDQLYGEDGHDILIATGGNDELYGGTGNDAMTGGDDNDYLEGNAGDDLLNGDLGVDVLLGGDGNDWLLGGGNLMPGLTAQQLADSATAPWGVITDANGNTGLAAVSGTIVNANDDSNMLDGGAGNDWLIGAGNSDFADGGADNDTLVGMAGDDDLRGGGGNDLIYGDATQGDITLGGTIQLYATADTHGNDYLDGGDGADTLIGDGGADELFGGSGDDTLIGDNSTLDEQYHGADYLDGEDGNDALYGYGKDDELFGGAGDDILEGDSNTIAQSLHGNDYLDGEDGNDKLQGDGGSDTLYGGAGNDQLFGDADDIATEYQGDDYLDGEAGDDYLRGYGGNDTLFGGDGNDGLLAEAGDDILIGGTGADQLQGGIGNDTYMLNLGDGQDTIIDASGSNTIEFGAGIVAADIAATYDAVSGNIALIYGPDTGNGIDSIMLADGFTGNVIQTYRFDDGSELTHAQLMELVLPALDYTGTPGDDNVSGSGHDDVMSGGAGHDTISSQGGDDMLDGGIGDDTLIGGTGHDTYQLNWNGGNDTVIEAAGENSNILIDSAFTIDNLNATRQGDDLTIALGSSTNRLTLQNYFLQPSQTWTITDASGNTISTADALAATESANQNNTDVIQRLWDNYASEHLAEGIHSYLNAGYQTTATYGVLTQSDRTATMNYISRSGNINHGDGSTSFSDSIQYTGLGDGTIEDRTATIALQTTNLAGGISTTIYGGGYSGGQVNQVLASINWGTKTATGHSTYTVIENSNGNATYSYLDQENGYINGTVSGYIAYSGVTPTYNTLPGQVVLNHLSVQEGVSITQVYGDDAEQYVEGNGLIDGGGGNDVLIGSYDALLYGNTGDDQLYNAAMMIGGAGDDTIIGSDGDNTTFYTRTGNGLDIVNDIEFIDEDSLTVSERNFYDWYYPQNGVADWRVWRGLGIPLPPVSINANDYAALKDYYLSTNSSKDTVEFASGVSLSDLTLSWTAVDGQVALQVSWNGDSTIKTLIPRSGDRIGTGIEQFRFADGTVIYIGDMIAMAPPHPDFDVTVAAFTHGGGGQLVDVIPETILADTGLDPAIITVNRDGDDLLLTAPSGEDSLRIANWYADPNAIPGTTIQFADGTVLDAATLTTMGQSNLIGGNHIDRQGSQSADSMDGSNGIANIMYGNAGGDYLSGGDMNDTLYGGKGNDNLYGQDGSDLLLGESGDDHLSGGNDNDTLLAGTGNDDLDGGNGNDTLDGGTGNDTLDGGTGNDAYIFGSGSGWDVVHDADATAGNIDQISMAAGVAPGDVTVTRNPANDDLILSLNNGADRLTLADWFTGDGYKVEQVVFADGTIWDVQALLDRVVIMGTGTDDTLVGTSGNDTLIGLQGNDTLDGGAGDDTYVFNIGDGVDVILDTAGPDGGNSLVFGAGITPADISLGLGSLLIRVGNNGDAIHLQNFDPQNALGNHAIDTFRFADGTTLSYAELLALGINIEGTTDNDDITGTNVGDRIVGLDGNDGLYGQDGDDILLGGTGDDTLDGGYGEDALDGGAGSDSLDGGNGNDVLDGGTGNDFLSGGEGDDVYVFGPGYGQDSVYDYDSNVGNVDTVRMADGVTPSDVTVTRDPNSLYLSLNGGANRLMLDSWFAGDENRIEQVEFSDGTVWGVQDLIDHIVDAVATEYSDALMGTTADDVIDGLNGDDFIIGMAGNDILRGGDGNDDLEDLEGRNYLAGEAGDDYLYADTHPSFIMGNSGSDSIASFAQNNVVAFNRGDGIDSITVGQALTLSLGGGIALADLSITGGGYGGFILETGGDTVALQGLDPADPTTWPEITLQLIDGDIRRYDLKAEIQAFNAAQAQDPALTSWPLNTTLDANLLDISTDQAIGGALAYQYAMGGSAAMPGDAALRGVLADAAFGSMPQSIDATVFDGTTGSDTLLGGNGADTLTGGAGNDVLAGGAGNDTYVFNLGDGIDHIQDTALAGEGNTLVFGGGITAADISLGLGSLLLRVGSNGDAIHLDNFNPGDATGTHTIETFRFADGTELSYSQLLAKGFDLNGSDGNDTLSGTSVTDRINGLAGDDVIDGGAGDDLLMGGNGSDTYLFGLGYGADSIEDQNTSGTDTNIVQMGAGVSASDIIATFDGTYLNLAINGTNDSLSILWDAQNGYGVQRVVFADGTEWDGAMLDALVTPSNSAPELVNPIPGQAGVENHVFTFQIPADTFVDPDVGDVLTYSATLANGAALPSWLSLNAATGVFSGTPGLNDAGTLSFIVMATDQGGLTTSGGFDLDIANLIQGTQYSDTLTGTAGNDYITAGTGNDTVNAGDGNDTIIGGVGSDVLAGGAGNDTFVVEGNDTGYDRFEGDAGYDVIQGGVGDDVIRLSNFSGAYTVEKIDGGAGVNVVAGTQYSDTIDLSGTELVSIAYITGTAGNDTIIGSAGDDTIIGDLGSDVLAGGVGNDTFLINGSDSGYDRFEGDAGYDVIQGGSGDDVIRVSNFTGVYTVEKIDGGAGTNTVAGTQYSDTIDLSGAELVNIAAIDGGLGNDTITGSAGNDVIIGGTGSDVLAGGSGNDTFLINGSDTGYDRFEGDAGYDVIQGGAGDDAIRVSNFTGTYTVEKIDGGAGTNTIAGTQYSDSIDLSGTELVNIAAIDGGLGNDTITGSAGDDVILGGIGSDVLAGGAGNDTFLIDGSDTGYDRFQGDAGYDVIQGGSADDVIRVSNFSGIYTVEKIDGGAGSNTIAGTQYSDSIDLSGTELVNIAAIDGGLGNDTITGSTGDDVIVGGTGADVLAGGTGNDTFLISGSDTNYDRFEGDAGYDVIQGGTGDDVIRVSNFSGAYTVEKIDGGAGSNIIAGTQYSDTIDLSATQLVNIGLLDGGAGNDTLTGSAGNDLIRGGDGADKLTDTSGSNLLDGGTGNDVLIGGAGNELLIGGTGNDTITTGNGYDVIAFNTGDGQDTVNASTGADNTISLGGGIKYADLSFSKSGNNLILKTGSTDQITLSNWYTSTSNHSVLDLQVISEAMADFAPGGSDVLKDNKVETFDFAGLVGAFDSALAATPTLTNWALTNALMDFHLSGSDTDAIGGDLAYQYGKAGTLAGIGLTASQSVINSAQFGQSAQMLQAASTWQSETVKLG